jgi:hypothetical protein
MIAEITARELRLTTDALDLLVLVLVMENEPGRRNRFAVCWLSKLLEEDPLSMLAHFSPLSEHDADRGFCDRSVPSSVAPEPAPQQGIRRAPGQLKRFFGHTHAVERLWRHDGGKTKRAATGSSESASGSSAAEMR